MFFFHFIKQRKGNGNRFRNVKKKNFLFLLKIGYK